MNFRFKGDKLRALYTHEEGAHRYPAAVVSKFFQVMSVISAAANESDLYSLKSLHYEKLKGARGRQGERSLRLNDQWRLIVRMEADPKGRTVLVIEISDHYK